jgi:hypothetical protein
VNGGELVGKYERLLLGWGTFALLIALAGRVAFSWFSARQIWLLDTQALVIPLFIGLAVFAALFVARELSAPSTAICGLVAWGLALSLIPRSLWWQSPALRAELPLWLQCAGVAVLLIALAARAVLARRWLAQLRGHGFQYIYDWAAGRPYFARLLAVRVLRSLGYWN